MTIGNRSRPLFRGESGGRASRHNDVDFEMNRFSDQRREPIVPTFCPAVFNRDILALNVLEIPQSLAKCGDEFGLKGSR